MTFYASFSYCLHHVGEEGLIEVESGTGMGKWQKNHSRCSASTTTQQFPEPIPVQWAIATMRKTHFNEFIGHERWIIETLCKLSAMP
jgi:hypothetical protein